MSSPVQKAAKRPRGRPRAYDPDTALRRATGAFWRHGFAGTSLDALTDAMDMNRPSLYGAFGDKRALYLAALDRYVAESVEQMRAALSEDVPLAQGLQRVYDGRSRSISRTRAPLGCSDRRRDRGGRCRSAKEARRRARGAHGRFEARFAAA
jgi:AcrR family transcriptional regulator